MNDITTGFIIGMLFGLMLGLFPYGFYSLLKEWWEAQKTKKSWEETQKEKPKPLPFYNVGDRISVEGVKYKITKVEPITIPFNMNLEVEKEEED